MKIKTITICSSGSFYKEVLEITRQLRKLDYRVLIPSTATKMQKSGNFDIDTYKTWYKNPKDYRNKRNLMDGHFKKVIKSDAILVVNNEKHGIKGYIGGNGLMEITLAYHYKKPIFILNEISENLPFKEEILGVNPIFLNGRIEKLTD